MKLSTKSVTLSLIAAFGAWAAPACSADITVYLNQATESGVRQLATGFEKATGYKVEVSFQGGPNLNQKIVSDSPGDLASLGLDQFADYIEQGKLVAEAVAAGEVDIGIQQTNVIQPVRGSEYLGPLPQELMEYGRVGIGLLTVSRHPDAARAF